MNEIAPCPHCGQPSIIVESRRYYSRGWPATCRECGTLAYDRPHGIVVTLLFFCDLLAAPLLLLLWILFPRTFCIVALLSVPLFIIYWRHMRGRSRPASRFRSISPDSSRLSRRLTYVVILVSLATFAAFLVVASRLR